MLKNREELIELIKFGYDIKKIIGELLKNITI